MGDIFDVRRVYMCWRKYIWACLWALISSTVTGDHFLRVSEKSHFSFWLCWCRKPRSRSWISEIVKEIQLLERYWWRQQSSKEKCDLSETFRKWSPVTVGLIRALTCRSQRKSFFNQNRTHSEENDVLCSAPVKSTMKNVENYWKKCRKVSKKVSKKSQNLFERQSTAHFTASHYHNAVTQTNDTVVAMLWEEEKNHCCEDNQYFSAAGENFLR